MIRVATLALLVAALSCVHGKLICPGPRPGSLGTCDEMCSCDDDCDSTQKCCSNGCGHECMMGTSCAAVSCLATTCSPEDLIEPGPDECCASCKCRYNGMVHNPGDSFPSTDGCNTCKCTGSGAVGCTRKACPPPPPCTCNGTWMATGYKVDWAVRGDMVTFEVSAETSGWVGLGFSLDRRMPNSDVVVAASDGNGNMFMVDGFTTRKARPEEDASFDLFDNSVTRVGGTVTMRFTRMRNTGDDRDLALNQSVFLLYAWGGNVQNYSAKSYSRHMRRTVSEEMVCFPDAITCPTTPLPEDPTGDPEDPTDDPEDPSDDPEDPTDDPEDPTDDPEDPSDDPEDPTGDDPEDPSDDPEDPTDDDPENPSDDPEDPTDDPEDPSDDPEDPTDDDPEDPSDDPEDPSDDPEDPSDDPEDPTDDSEDPTDKKTEIYIEVSDYGVPESTGAFPCPILLSEPYPEPITVTIDVTTVSGEGLCESATRDVDFVANIFPATVVIPANTILFPAGFEIIDDCLVECNESFQFSLTYSGGQPGVRVRSDSESGTFTIIDDDTCNGAWMTTGYKVDWAVRGDMVTFEVSAETSGWVGLGFSLDRRMPNSDVVVAASDGNGNMFMVDGFTTGKARPEEDASFDLFDNSVTRVGDTVTIRFTRMRNTGDDRDLALNQSVFLLYAWGGNVQDFSTKSYSRHMRRTVSQEMVCFPDAITCPSCRYNGMNYNLGDSFNSTDGCNTCTCSETGDVACTERACLPEPQCTSVYCDANAKKLCYSGQSKTGCQACYYATGDRSVACRYRCGMNPRDKCLKKWAKCLKKKLRKIRPKTRANQQTPNNYRCVVPPIPA